jgi:hypothetical protein
MAKDKPKSVTCEGEPSKPYKLWWMVNGKRYQLVGEYNTEAAALANKPKRLDSAYSIWHGRNKLS